MADDGKMATGKTLFNFAKKHKLKIGKIEDLIAYRLKREKLIKLKKLLQSLFKNKNLKLKYLKIFLMGLKTLH